MLITLFYFILALVILVVFHEFGHFQVARWCGVKVLRFSFGFGKILLRKTDKKGTEYVWSLVPLGGYVKMLDETEGDVLPHERHQAFNRQPVWKKACIVLAGPLFNFLFAFAALWLVAVIGVQSLAPIIEKVKVNSLAANAGVTADHEVIAINDQAVKSWQDFQFDIMPFVGSDETIRLTLKNLKTKKEKIIPLSLKGWTIDSNKPDLLASLGITPFIPRVAPVIGQIVDNSPAATENFKIGDKIISLNGQPVDDWLTLVAYTQAHPNGMLQLQILRDGNKKSLSVRIGEKINAKGEKIGFLGLGSEKVDWPKDWLRSYRLSPLKAIPVAFDKTLNLSTATVMLMGRLVSGRLGLDNISGPVGIAQGAGDSARGGLVYYLSFLALVSISLGVLNLLPIPMLDGGHLLFYLIEAILRKPISEAIKSLSMYLGMMVLIALMLVALVNDISRLVS